MSTRLQVAFAVLAGYYLGRRRKLRMAAALAAAGLAGRVRSGEGGLLAQGIKAVGSSAELQQITDRLRGELVEVGKAAAIAATSRQIDSLSGKLHERAESIREPEGAKAAGQPIKEPAAAEDEDYEEEGYEEEEPEEPEQPEKSKAQRPTRPVRRAGQSRG
ncbi:hypothetical protein [Nonomuraea sp. NPDC050643]|uniref:hypothetical protein n=1 Tax=Nonomuraea sp. NPDC050643 TaxID=3155660 RepID=UPI0033D9B41E